MDPLKIKDKYLSQNCIEKCIERFEQIKNETNPILNINFVREVQEIDPLLLAYLILFKKHNKELQINLNFVEGILLEKKRTLFQNRSHIKLTTGEVFFNIVGDTSDLLSKELFIWSEKFMPIILIDEESYKTTFLTEPNFINLQAETLDISTKDKAYQSCRTYLYNHYSIEKNNGLDILTQLAFYNALDETNILRIYLYDAAKKISGVTEQEINENNIRVSGFSTPNAISFYEEVKKNIFDKLMAKPPIYHFIYTTLLSSKLLPQGQLKDNISGELQRELINLWTFTLQLVDGLQELAKNIIEHSSNKRGLITGRVYGGEILEELEKGDPKQTNLFKIYLSNYEGKTDVSFFNINIIDDGELGVIEKLKLDLENSDFESEKEDVEKINNNEIKFRHFLDLNEGLLLNQQAKRATAHLGLLIFSKLIEYNEGMIRAGTWLLGSNQKLRDVVIVLPKDVTHSIKAEDVSLCNMGTNFHILLPFNPKKPLEPHIAIKYEIPTETTAVGLQSIESLLTYKVKDFTTPGYDPKIESKKKYLFITGSSENKSLINREDEKKYWKDIMDSLLPIHIDLIKGKNKEKIFLCLNLEGIKIESSKLFRLFGRLELEFPGRPLILLNIPNEELFKLTKINEYYFEKFRDRMPYWNENSLAIIYSYAIANKGRFYFTDALWGKTRKDYLFVNHLISKTNFSATILSLQIESNNDQEYKDALIDEELQRYDKELLTRFGVFQEGITLFPFELLLKSLEGISLFEHNAMVLLQNQILTERGL